MKSVRKGRWWQFSLRWLFVAMLVVAAYAAGRSHQNTDLHRELDIVKKSRADAQRQAQALKEEVDRQREMNLRILLHGPSRPRGTPGASR